MSFDGCSDARPVQRSWKRQVTAHKARGLLWIGSTLLGMLLGAACGDDGTGEDTCLAPLPTECSPTFTASWDNVYSAVVQQKCASAPCHGAQAKEGGLELSSSIGALRALLGEDDGRARVIPEDPECSILMQRLNSTDPERRMPLGGSLSATDRCAVQLWIQEGAKP